MSKSTATSPVSSPTPLESRQRSSTSVSSKLRLPSQEDRSRSGSIVLPHIHSTSSLRKNSPSPTPPSPELPITRTDQGSTLPLATVKIKSKVSALAKSNGVEIESPPSLSSTWAISRSVHTRPPIPSLSSGFSLNASPSLPSSTSASSFYPITTAAPAANPHRYTSPGRALSPTRHAYQTFTPSEAPSKARQVLKAKVDPASIPLPPHSPPISAISLSSKSSISRSSFTPDRSPKSDASASTVNSHTRKRSNIEFARSSPVDHHDGTVSPTTNGRRSSQGRDSDIDSGSSEHNARVAAKSNRKVIFYHSLLHPS